MTNDPTPSLEERQLQEIFDETATPASDAQLARMSARAEQIPQGRRRKRWSLLMTPLAAAAAVAIAIGGAAWWAQHRVDAIPVASTALALPTGAPSAAPTKSMMAVAPVDQDSDAMGDDDIYVDESLLPADPLAVLDGDHDSSGSWMSELDLLHGPIGDGSDDFWQEMELLMEEGG